MFGEVYKFRTPRGPGLKYFLQVGRLKVDAEVFVEDGVLFVKLSFPVGPFAKTLHEYQFLFNGGTGGQGHLEKGERWNYLRLWR